MIEDIQNKKWFDLTEKEMVKIHDKEKRKEYLKLYHTMWVFVVSPLADLLKFNLNIEGRLTIKNVVTQYREALLLLGISREEQIEYIKKKFNETKSK